MAISLYEASVTSYLQILGSVAGYLDRGLKHCQEKGIDPESVVATRLYEDMLPFRFQIQSVAHHSRGAAEALLSGKFLPPLNQPEHDYAGLQALVAQARDTLQKMTPAEINAREGADVVFELGAQKLPFTAEGFVLSFSLPNFYFHASTAYDILRTKGVPLGKRHFLGALRMKT